MKMIDFTFLICSERSGSNFATSLMNGHYAISGPPPTHLFRLFGTNMQNYGDLSKDENWNILIEDFVLNFESKLGYWHSNVTIDELKAMARVRTSSELLRIIYNKEAGVDGAGHVFVKENHTFQFAPYLLSHFPGCRFLYMVRDPRDVASSFVKTDDMPGGVEKAVDIWIRDQAQSLSLYYQLYGTGKIHLIRYEDILTQTEENLKRITDFLELPFDEEMLAFWKNSRTRINAERIEAWSNLSQSVLHDNFGKYRHTLNSTDIRYIELSCFDLMNALGYQTDIVKELPETERTEKELRKLRPLLNPGRYTISNQEEQQIRKNRLAAINRVLARRL